jgi:proton-translocating NADH-quinone oxidoreductase chain N
MNASLFPWIFIIPLISSPLVYLSGRIGSRNPILNKRSWLVRFIALAAILVTWVPFYWTWQEFSARSGRLLYSIEAIWLQADGISLLLAAVSLSLTSVVILFSGPYMAGEVGEEKYYAMLLAMTGLMIGLGCANDLFNLWIWFEAMAISSYLLVAFYREQAASLEAGMKYLVQSACGSILVLMGIALVLSQTGSLDIDHIKLMMSSQAADKLAMLAAGGLFVIGFGVKVALVPLHTWLPDAHSQAPSGISAMLSGVVIEAGLVAMLRSLTVITGASISWGTLLLAFGALNMFFGNLMALRQTQVKRMLAYSSLSHIGYMLLGLGIALSAGEPAAAQGAFFHLFNHMIMKGLAFLSAGALMYALFHHNGSHAPLTVADLAGASKKYPLVALAMSLAVLALGGLPPLAGFMSKWQIFVAGFQTRDAWMIGLVIFAALNSVLSLAYYAPIVNTLYREKPGSAVEKGGKIPFAMQFSLVLLSLAVIVLGLWPGLMNWLTEPAGQALMTAFGK